MFQIVPSEISVWRCPECLQPLSVAVVELYAPATGRFNIQFSYSVINVRFPMTELYRCLQLRFGWLSSSTHQMGGVICWFYLTSRFYVDFQGVYLAVSLSMLCASPFYLSVCFRPDVMYCNPWSFSSFQGVCFLIHSLGGCCPLDNMQYSRTIFCEFQGI